jgi:hypothetical protein
MARITDGNQTKDQTLVLFALVTTAVFISRIPFLSGGYGNDWDSWEIASAAREIAVTGTYTASRLPGYPLPELFYSLAWDGGYFLFNAITAAIGAVGIGFFSLILHKLGSRDSILASIALAFIPVIYINSTVTHDYIWASSFFLVSMYFAMHSRGLVSGLFLGLAIGSRITSAFLLLPLGMIAWDCSEETEQRNTMVGLSLTASLIGVLCYVPVFMTYGWDFLTLPTPGSPPLLAVVRVFTFQVWGGVGLIAVGIAAICLFLQRFQPNRTAKSLSASSGQAFAWLTAIALYLVIFFLLPHEAGYLIPALPFIVLLLACFLGRTWFILFCVLLIFSPFFLSVSSRNVTEITGVPALSNHAIHIDIPGNQVVIDPLYGPLIFDHRQRVYGMLYTGKVLEAAKQLNAKSIIVAGAWLTKIEPIAGDLEQVEFVYLIENEGVLENYLSDGFRIYYLPGQLEYNRTLYGIDLEAIGATLLDVQN